MKVTWKLAKKQADEIHSKDSLLFVEGSAGAGKTIYAAHKTLLYGLEHRNARMGVFRDTLTALKATSLLEIRELLDAYKIPYNENKNEHIITLPTRSKIYFRGLDDFKKIRSLNLDFIWVEQAEEIDYYTFQEIKRRLRGKTGKNSYLQFILTYTPELEDDWIYVQAHRNGKGRIIHFSYKDNPFLPKEYVKDIEDLQEEDWELWVKYGLGQFGKLSNIIYNKWDKKPLPNLPKKWTAGVDFGYNNPSVFLLVGWYDGEPYIVDEVYKRHLITSDFIAKVDELLAGHGLKPHQIESVYCDSSEPDRIEEFKQAGYNSLPGTKKFTERIDKVKRVKVHIAPDCIETVKEIKTYKFKKDRDGNVLEIPIDKFNHAMDAMGYCIYGEIGDNTGNPFTDSKKRYDAAKTNLDRTRKKRQLFPKI